MRMHKVFVPKKQKFLQEKHFSNFGKKGVDESGFIGYNSFNFRETSCEEKSRRKDAVQRALIWCDGVRIETLNMVSELRRR